MTLQITRVETPTNKYNVKCPYAMTPTRIVIHNTANKASAMSEISYMLNNNNEVSYHFAVDNVRAVQGLPLNRNGWHAGDGGNGTGNRKGIAIEICYSTGTSEQFSAAERNGAILTAMLLKQYGWGIDKVTKHQDYSGKYCPHKTLDLGWQRFVNMVKEELDKLNGTTTSATTSNTSGLEAYSGYVEVTYGGSDGLSYHNKPSWADSTVAGVAKKGDVFTVVGRIKVDGTYMYKLKSGNYITSASKYVTFRKDLHGSSGSTASASSSKSYAGKTVKLSKKPVYASASSKSSSGTLTGTYYYWNNEVINGRIRVTNAKSRVGVKGQVTGWIQL